MDLEAQCSAQRSKPKREKGRAERGAACVSLSDSPLRLIDISLTKVKYNSPAFINMRKGPRNQTHHLVKTTV